MIALKTDRRKHPPAIGSHRISEQTMQRRDQREHERDETGL